MNAQTEPTEAAESQEDGRANAGADKGKEDQQQQAGQARLGSPSTPSLRTSESHAKKRKKSGAAEAAGGSSDHPVQNNSSSSNEESHGMVKRDRGDTRKSGQKKKSSERKEAKQDEREARAVMTTGPDSDATPHDVTNGAAEDGKACHDGKGDDDALHPPTPWPGRFLHGFNSSGAVKTATAAGKKHSADVSSAPEDKHKRKEKRTEKEGAASPETKPRDSQGSPSLSPDKRRRDEKQRSKEESRRESKLEVACDQQRRASSELLRGHKEKGRAFWNKERTPRRGILSRSLSAESLARTSTKCASLDDETLFKRKKHKKHKRKGLQDEGVKFDKVVVRHYPREVCIGGCMLDPNQGPFLGIGWDWKQEEVHNLYSFERLRESPDRTHIAHAIPSATRHALLVQYGLKEDEIQEMILEMRRRDKELLRGSAATSILPSFWPWKRVG